MTDDTEQQPDYTPEEIELARRDEETTAMQATIQFLQNRVVLLNLEVRKRDNLLAEKQEEIDRLRVERVVEQRTATERRRETPDVVRGDVEGVSADTDT